MMRKSLGLISGLAIVGSLVVAAPAHAADSVTAFTVKNGQSPTSAPNCYPAAITLDMVDSESLDQVNAPNSVDMNGEEAEAWCYGTTYLGGSNNNGVIYRVKPDGSNYKVLASFNVGNGLTPSQAPVLSPDREHLYGTTSQGGSNGSGLIYDYAFDNGKISTVSSFSGKVGTTPQAPPILENGVLYGITGQSGANGYGTIWSQSVSGGKIKALHSFAGGKTDGATPFGALTWNPIEKRLYGMTFAGGANGLGGIFSIEADGKNYTWEASFDSKTGGRPQMGALTMSKRNAEMYGNTWSGASSNGGAIFKFTPKTKKIQTIFNYDSKTGAMPYNTLAISPTGNWLYSVTWKGGENRTGTILAVSADGKNSHVLKSFDKGTGGLPFAGVSLSPNGTYLLTATAVGGANGVGSLVGISIPKDYR